MKDDNAVDRIVGERLRTSRKAVDMTLEALARASDRSIGYISQIERGLSSPTIRDVAVFARVLGVPFVDLLKEPLSAADDTPVRLNADRFAVAFRGSGITKRILAPRNRGSIECYLMEIDQGGTTGDEAYAHDGEEAGFVIKGAIDLTIGGHCYRLSRGDSFRFPSRTAHGFRNASTGPSEVLWVNVGSVRGR